MEAFCSTAVAVHASTTSLVGPAARTTASASQTARSQDASTEARSWDTYSRVVPVADDLTDALQALLLEVGVADGQDLVHQQHVGLEEGGDRESEAHLHAHRDRT